CAQMRGVSLRQASLDIVEPILDKGASAAAGAAVTDGASASHARQEIVLTPPTPGPTAPVGREKPAAIALGGLSTPVSTAAAPSANKRAPITLSTPGAHLSSDLASDLASSVAGRVASSVTGSVAGSAAPAVSFVRLYDDGNGIFSIEIAVFVS